VFPQRVADRARELLIAAGTATEVVGKAIVFPVLLAIRDVVLLATSEARPASPLAVGGYAYLERLAAARTAHALPDDIHGVPAWHRSLQKGSQVLERRTERTVLSI